MNPAVNLHCRMIEKTFDVIMKSTEKKMKPKKKKN